MPAEPPPEPSPPAPPPGRPASPSGSELAEAERRLAAPTPLALRLLGVMFLATVLPWAGAKVACNDRNSPVRQPHDLTTEVAAKSAKSAALELAQRAASGLYGQAAELARGEAAEALEAAEQACQADPAPCERRRAQRERVFTRAVLASRGPFEATARTESRVADGPPERFALRLEQVDGKWSVVRRTPLDGPVDGPVLPEEVVSPIAIRPASAPAASGAPRTGAPHGSAPSSGSASEP